MRTEQEIRRALEFCELTKKTCEEDIDLMLNFVVQDTLKYVLGEESKLEDFIESKGDFSGDKTAMRDLGFE